MVDHAEMMELCCMYIQVLLEQCNVGMMGWTCSLNKAEKCIPNFDEETAQKTMEGIEITLTCIFGKWRGGSNTNLWYWLS
jgi:hypothetical protein